MNIPFLSFLSPGLEEVEEKKPAPAEEAPEETKVRRW